MNKEQFYNYLINPSLITNIKESDIDEIIKEFPYFQSAHLLKAKILAEKKSIKFDNQIKISSLYAIDRKLLYEYIHTTPQKEHKTEIVEPILQKEEIIKEKIVEKPFVEEKKITKTISDKKKTETEKVPEEVSKTDTITSAKQEPTAEIKEKTAEKSKKEIIIPAIIEKEAIKPVTKPKPEKEKIDKTPKHTIIPTGKKTIADEILEKLEYRKKDKSQESIADKILKNLKEKKNLETSKPKEKLVENIKKKPIYFVKYNKPLTKPKELLTNEKTDEIKKEKTKKKIYFVKINKKKLAPIIIKEEIPKLEEIIEKPIQNFILEEKTTEKEISSNMSFSDWLNFVENRQEKPKKHDKFSLIDKFISENPNIEIKAETENPNTPDYFSESKPDNENYITETLADIYIKQGLYEKAILSLEKLSLKYPQKSIYFANRIKEVKKLIKN